MKIRFGALALMAVLAACSSQDQTKTGDSQKGNQASASSSGVGPAIAGYSYDSKRTLGGAPDRGELFTYQKGAAVLHEGAYTLRPVALSEEHAIRAAVTGVMAIPGPDGKDIKIAYERHEEHPDGNWSWIGRVVGGDQAQEAIFTFGQDAVFGSIPQANGPSLKLTTQRGIAYLMQADASRLFRGQRAGNDVKVAAYRPSQEGGDSTSDAFVEMATAKVRATASADVSTKAFTSANTVDLVAGYSNGLAARLGSDGAAVTRLNQLVVVANQALLNSKVNARIRLVGVVKVNYADNTDNGIALDQLTGNDGQNAVTVPAALAPLRTARDTTGADLVTLVRDFQQTNNGCGIAWLLGANGQNIVPASDSPFGYSIVSDGDYDLNGDTYFCEDITLIHELAHNMGSAHDVANAGGTPGRFPYSYGYKTTAAAGNFFTVMAYGEDNQTLYRVFSNPNITTCGGRACGVANSADNARSLAQTVAVVATFRATVVPIRMAANDFNGDGFSDVFWRNSSGTNTIWRSANSASRQTVITVNPAFKVVGTGDFNGDGSADVLWRNASTGVNSIWMSGNSATAQAVTRVANLAFKVVGTADYNGDGKADILWRNANTGANTIWLSGNSATVQAVTSVPAQWAVAGSGDFDGDGKSDILWRNTSTGANAIWKSGNATTGQTVTSIPSQAWHVVGVGDFDFDGKSDILWRNSSSGANTIWKSGNSATVQAVSTLTVQAWKVSGTGDYNGDGKSDILWRNASTGASSIWLSGLSTTVRAITAVTDLSWQIVP